MFRTSHLFLKLSLFFAVIGGLFVIYLDARITATFSDKMWDLPARVYARPLELFEGAPVKADDFAYELRVLGYRAVNSPRNPGEFSRYRDRFDLYTRGFDFPGEREASRRVLIEFADRRVQRLSAAGSGVDLMRLDPVHIGGIYPQHGEDRALVRLNEVPETLTLGLMAVEDRDFYQHWGFSITGIARAAWSNLRSGRVVAGGSTISQQLVKNYYLTSERTIVRKLVEVVMAVLLELHYDKDQILESYINEIYLGQEGRRSVHGFELASQHYFDAPLATLGLAQQALLIGMIKGPSLYNPERNPERSIERRNVVLGVMAEQGVISVEQAAVAKAMPLGLNRQHSIRGSFPAFLDLVRRQLRREYRDEDLATRGLSIFTSFDPVLQRQLERSTIAVMDQLDSSGELQSAAVVTRFDTGEVAALLGGRRAKFAGFNRALDARRPAGSLLKPAVYLAALEKPAQYSLATELSDTPLTVKTPGSTPWQPQNFDRRSHGSVTLYEALAKSYNLASARLGMTLGLADVTDMLARLGVEKGVPAVPALLLGAGEYAPIDMAVMYQSIAAGGFRMPLRSIRDIVDANGEPLRRYPLEYDRTASLQSVHLLHYALRAVMREGTGQGAYRYLGEGFDVAGKTGTTNEGRDSWFAGFSGDLLAVIWIGRDDNGSTRLTGSSGALKVWAHFMSRSSRQPLAYRMPDGVEPHWVDERNGFLTGKGCPRARLLPFIKGSEPDSRTDCAGAQKNNGIRDWFDTLFGGKD
ncbi:penicillin-binding protein 1B [Candidatus Marimicrobium litorale]|uniref:Penicillin-binding protein 1B n=1 Tax=Candidatus Marimicrobium litorale TaxID=2518991 RepID=A0ABT3TA46_9GAMM|nr:penicillin-binding protein 1B [Candidatus Marimicrobium litorale]MCX2979176.1 penicillin-binding protein 1B [Candidatus Marimicrobium litorale]